MFCCFLVGRIVIFLHVESCNDCRIDSQTDNRYPCAAQYAYNGENRIDYANVENASQIFLFCGFSSVFEEPEHEKQINKNKDNINEQEDAPYAVQRYHNDSIRALHVGKQIYESEHAVVNIGNRCPQDYNIYCLIDRESKCRNCAEKQQPDATGCKIF